MKAMMKTLIATASVVAATGSMSVMAAPLTELYFSQHAGWVNPTTDVSAATGFNGGVIGLNFAMQGGVLGGLNPADTYAGMQWTATTAPLGTSSIAVTGHNSNDNLIAFGGDLDSSWEENEWWLISTLTQNNETLGSPSTAVPNPLWVADVLANLRIFDNMVGGNTVLEDLNSATRISFWETLNQAPCTNPNPAGSVCNDIYTLLTAELDSESFVIGDYLYTLNFTLVPQPGTVICQGNTGSVAACSSLPNDNNTRVFTPEGQNSNISVAMSWNVREVPEPSTLALLGISLLGFGFARSRNQK